MGKILARNITVHTKDETGAHQTFRFKAGEEVPDSIAEHISNPDVWAVSGEEEPPADLIGDVEEPLMKRTHDELVQAAELWGAEGVSAQNKKAELAAAIRAAGYEGDGGDDLFGED